MKILFEYEDCIVGILIGILFIGLAGTYFTVPEWPIIWAAAFGISFILTILDMRHTFSDMKDHPILLIVLLMNNAADFIIELGAAAFMLGISVPYISEFLDPYLRTSYGLLAIGIFFIASSVFWLFEFAAKKI